MFADGNLLIVLLPLVALVLAGLSVAGLWLWWDMSREEDDEESGAAPDRPEPGEPRPEAPPAADRPAGRVAGWLKHRIPEAKPERPDVPPPPVPPAPAAPPGDAIEVFRIYRDLADGALIVEMHGRRYRSIGEITDAQVGRRFLGNVKALAYFARLGDVEVPDEWEAGPPPSPREESSEFSPPEPPGPFVPPPPPPPTSPPPASQPAESSSLLGGLFGRGAQQAEPEESVDVRPMAEQIEELLQHRLTASPGLRQRSIHVRSAADGGVRIEVDGRFYDGVGDVEDEDVRNFIQSIIREWEARQ